MAPIEAGLRSEARPTVLDRPRGRAPLPCLHQGRDGANASPVLEALVGLLAHAEAAPKAHRRRTVARIIRPAGRRARGITLTWLLPRRPLTQLFRSSRPGARAHTTSRRAPRR